MSGQPTYSRFKTPIGAHEEITNHSSGNLVSVLAATGEIEIALGDGPMIPLDVGQTISFQDEEFDKVRVLDKSGATNTVDVYVGRGEFFDLRFSAAGDVRTKPHVPETLISSAAVACATGAVTLLAAQNPERAKLVLVVDSGAAGPVYVSGNAGALAGQGIPVQPGQSFDLESTSAVHVRNDTGGAVSVWAMQSEWST